MKIILIKPIMLEKNMESILLKKYNTQKFELLNHGSI